MLPSVTQIINRVVPREWCADEWALNRGRMVHLAMSMYLRGTLDMDSLDPRIVGRVSAAIKACKDFGWLPALIEQHLAHPVYQYAGTPDAVMEGGVCVDWKGGILDGAVGIQLGGYAVLCDAANVRVSTLIGVHTRDDGTYRHEEYKLLRARGQWMGFLSVYGWCVENGKGNQ